MAGVRTLESRKFERKDIFVYGALVFLAALMLLPLVYMVSTSLKNDSEVHSFPSYIIPRIIVWRNYTEVFTQINLLAYIKNSFIVSAFATVGTVLSSAFVAYGFARYKARAKNFLFMVIICTLLLPFPALVIPQFLVFLKLGWVDTFLPLIAPSFFGSAYNIFLLRQFYTSVPDDLFEAARMDGCSEIRTWWNIAMPLCASALATVAVFAFIWNWNDMMGPVIYLNSEDRFTLPIGLASLYSPTHKTPWNTIMVGSFYALLPIVIIFFRAQKYFVQGITISGLK